MRARRRTLQKGFKRSRLPYLARKDHLTIETLHPIVGAAQKHEDARVKIFSQRRKRAGKGGFLTGKPLGAEDCDLRPARRDAPGHRLHQIRRRPQHRMRRAMIGFMADRGKQRVVLRLPPTVRAAACRIKDARQAQDKAITRKKPLDRGRSGLVHPDMDDQPFPLSRHMIPSALLHCNISVKQSSS